MVYSTSKTLYIIAYLDPATPKSTSQVSRALHVDPCDNKAKIIGSKSNKS